MIIVGALGALGAPAWSQDVPAADPGPQAIPGVLPERFRLPGTPVPSPTPTPTPAPAPTQAPTSGGLVKPVIVPLPGVRPRPTPAAAPSPVRTPVPVPQPTAPATTPMPLARTSASPGATLPRQVPTAPRDAPPGWPWFVLAATGVAALAGAGWGWRRRRAAAAPEPAMPVPERAIAASARPVARPAPQTPVVAEPFAVEIVSANMVFLADAVAFDLEIDVVNAQARAVEGLRPALALISASPDQDRWRAAFHAAAPAQNQVAPVDLAPGGRLRLPARLTLRREQLHVVGHGGRNMFVTMLLCDLRWRAGLSLHHFGADFLLGTAGRGARPGPIWLDRPAPAAIAAIRYLPA